MDLLIMFLYTCLRILLLVSKQSDRDTIRGVQIQKCMRILVCMAWMYVMYNSNTPTRLRELTTIW